MHVDRYFREKVFPGDFCSHSYFAFYLFFNVVGAFYDDGSQPVNKKEIYKAITDCRKAHTRQEYSVYRSLLMVLCGNLNVRPGRVKNAVPFARYFDSNWDNIAPMWVYAFRKELPLQVKCMLYKEPPYFFLFTHLEKW